MARPSSYHHPALRATLLKAAAAELREFGTAGFSLRRIAARAGVSHAAPYRHFRDRDALLAALIWESREEFTTAMRAALSRGRGSSQARLSRVTEAYLGFARANPERLSLMFSETGLAAIGKYPAPAKGEEATRYDSFAVLETTVKECQAEGILDPKATSFALSILVWSVVHGLSAIEREGYLEVMGRLRGFSAGTERRLVLDAFDTLVSRNARPLRAGNESVAAGTRRTAAAGRRSRA